MSKITKTDLLNFIQEQADKLVELTKLVELNKRAIIKLENERENPQLKKLDQNVFDELDEKWRWAAVDRSGLVKAFTYEPKLSVSRTSFILLIGNTMDIGTGYDAANWQYSLIERNDIAKELLEVDLSSELTGSELCKAMLKRGDKVVMCAVSDDGEEDTLLDEYYVAVSSIGVQGVFETYDHTWLYATPINNQGEPLTARDVGI